MAVIFIDHATGWLEMAELSDKEKSRAKISQLLKTTWLEKDIPTLEKSFLIMVQKMRKKSYLFYMTSLYSQ